MQGQKWFKQPRGVHDSEGPAILVQGSHLKMDRCFIKRQTEIEDGEALRSNNAILWITNSVISYKLPADSLHEPLQILQGGPHRLYNSVVIDSGTNPHGVLAMYYDYGIFGPSSHFAIRNTIINRPVPEELILSHFGSTNDSIMAGVDIQILNIRDIDPMFADPANDDFGLRPGSPAIDTGEELIYIPPYDFDDNPRPVDIPCVGNEGENTTDIGAYEMQLGDGVGLTGDLNGDCIHDPLDLFIFGRDWMKSTQ